MICKHITKRSYQKKPYFYCRKLKKVINGFEVCEKCLKIEPRYSKPIKKVSKKRVFVKTDIYDEVAKRDHNMCRLCGNPNIELHHIEYRSEAKEKINDIDNCIMLCIGCHDLVHSNKHYWQPFLKELIKKVKGE